MACRAVVDAIRHSLLSRAFTLWAHHPLLALLLVGLIGHWPRLAGNGIGHHAVDQPVVGGWDRGGVVCSALLGNHSSAPAGTIPLCAVANEPRQVPQHVRACRPCRGERLAGLEVWGCHSSLNTMRPSGSSCRPRITWLTAVQRCSMPP